MAPVSLFPLEPHHDFVTALAQGSGSAWRRLNQEFSPLLRGLSRQWGTRNDADCEDLSQDTLVQVMSRIDSYRGCSLREFRGWVAAILLRKVRDRQRRHHPVVSLDAPAPGEEASWADLVADPGAQPSEAVAQLDFTARVSAAVLSQISPRASVARAVWREMTTGAVVPRDIAARLGISRGAAAAHQCALRQLARQARHALEGVAAAPARPVPVRSARGGDARVPGRSRRVGPLPQAAVATASVAMQSPAA